MTTIPNVGDLAPDFTLRGTDGRRYAPSHYRGRAVLLVFLRHWR